ncbi:hypothetical protein [Bacillus infantis]|uniref:hypothetical protein n=1 Tax=Bacillus infantis TaxID=324767 RepID=UPI00321AC7FF
MYEITSNSKMSIDYAATGIRATLQSAQFLLNTILSSCPMDRSFGWLPPVDEPGEHGKVQVVAQIFEKFQQHLPELTVKDILFHQDPEEGKLQARVKVEINNGQV